MHRRRTHLIPFFLALLLLLLLSGQVCRAEEEEGEEDTTTTSNNQRQEAAQRMIQVLSPLAEDASAEIVSMSNQDVLMEDLKLLFSDELELLLEAAAEEDNDNDKDKIFYADRHVQNMLDITNDPDCMTGSLDASADDFTEERAVEVLTKCGLLVIRNAVPKDILQGFRQNVTKYVSGLNSGRINPQGTTSYGEQYFIHEVSKHRYDICFTDELLNEDIIGSEMLLDILEDPRVLGEGFSLLDFGAVLSEPGAAYQHWHGDGEIYEDNLFQVKGLAGMDLPPFAIGVMTPLLNVTAQHGPTEFCLGINAISRIDADSEELPPIRNKTLEEAFIRATDYYNEGCCPPEFFRAPELNFGDIALFHYNTWHRGGENVSPDLRVVLYNTYALGWYKDKNFMYLEGEHGSDDYFKELFKFARIGVPQNKSDEEQQEEEDPSVTSSLDALERLEFDPKGGKKASDWQLGVEYGIIISNVDVDLEDLVLCYQYDPQSDDPVDCYQAPKIGDFIEMRVISGGDIIVMKGETELKSWNIKLDEQIMLKHQFFDVCVSQGQC